MNISLILIFILVFLFYLVLPFLILLLIKDIKIRDILICIFLVIFSTVLLVGVVSNFYFTDKYFCVYFDFSNTASKTIDFDIFNNSKIDTFINLVMLIPIGMTIVVFNSQNKKRKLILLFTIGFAVGFVIEFLQLVLPIYRSVQLIDVINNGISVIIGGGIGEIYIFIVKTLNSKNKKNNL